jgi:homoserine dehydrogenase
VQAASDRGERIRLVGTLNKREDGTIEAAVAPRALAGDDPLAQARGIAPQGRVVITGPGAGGPATAAGVVADLVRLARGGGSTWAGLPAAEAAP